jgi:hypothetical protein
MGCGRYLGKGAALSDGEYFATSGEETLPTIGGDWRPTGFGGVPLRMPTGGVALEGRRQEDTESDFEGPVLGLGVVGTFGPPKDTPPEMTTVVDAVFGGAAGVSGVC